jgi:hypothetical protein
MAEPLNRALNLLMHAKLKITSEALRSDKRVLSLSFLIVRLFRCVVDLNRVRNTLGCMQVMDGSPRNSYLILAHPFHLRPPPLTLWGTPRLCVPSVREVGAHVTMDPDSSEEENAAADQARC